MCVHGLHSNKGNLYTLKVSIFTFLRNIIILLHFYATHVIQVFVYLLSLQSNKLSYSAPSVYHYLYLNRKKLPERTRLILFMCNPPVYLIHICIMYICIMYIFTRTIYCIIYHILFS